MVVIWKPKGIKTPTFRYWPEVSASQLSLAYIPDFTIARRKEIGWQNLTSVYGSARPPDRGDG